MHVKLKTEISMNVILLSLVIVSNIVHVEQYVGLRFDEFPYLSILGQIVDLLPHVPRDMVL